jgi:hypothetical protein
MQKFKEYAGKALTAIKDGYFWLVDWVDENPQKSLWLAASVLVAALVI